MSSSFSLLMPGPSSDPEQIAEWAALVARNRLHRLWLRADPADLVALTRRTTSTPLAVPVTVVIGQGIDPASGESIGAALDAVAGAPEVSVVVGGLRAPELAHLLRRQARGPDRRLRIGTVVGSGDHPEGPDTDDHGAFEEIDADFVVVTASPEDIVSSSLRSLRRADGSRPCVVALVDWDPARDAEPRAAHRDRVEGTCGSSPDVVGADDRVRRMVIAGVDEIVVGFDSVARDVDLAAALAQARQLVRRLPTEWSGR